MANQKPQSLNHMGPKRKAPPAASGAPNARAPAAALAAEPLAVRPTAESVDGEYLLFPTAPLVFGTGRPLDFGLGGETLAFPFPSTVAGALRAAVQAAKFKPPNAFAETEPTRLTWLTLARLGPAVQPLFPCPADVLSVGGQRTRLVPQENGLPADVYTDLPAGVAPLALATTLTAGKPDPMQPWWSAEAMQHWLLTPDAPFHTLGDKGPQSDSRTHNVIEPLGKGTVEGGLFRSTGMEFRSNPGYALAVAFDNKELKGSARRLGGEGRFVRIEGSARLALRDAPAALKLALAEARRIRCILLTPAIFEQGGWCPDWLALGKAGDTMVMQGVWPGEAPDTDVCGLKLVAAAITRAQSYSGWQPERPGGAPGPGRAWRVVPAGSVFWFDLPDGTEAASLWGRSLCADPWRCDGWGRCLIGVA